MSFDNNPYMNYPQYGYGYQQQMQQRGQMANMQQPIQPRIQMPTQPPMPMQYEIPLRETKFVTSEEAKAYIVMPNSASLLIDKQQGIAYLKSADNMGQSFMEIYTFTKYGENAPKLSRSEETTPQSIDLSSYVKKDEIGAFKFAKMEDLEKLSAKIEQMAKNMPTQKQSVPTKQL